MNDRAKKRLKQIKWLDAQIDGLIQDLADAQAKATKVTSAISPVVVSRSTDPDQLEAGVLKIIELKKQINQKIDELVDRKREIESIIEKVEDADQVMVLRKRYFEYKSWEQIAVEVGCKYRNVHYIHGDALKIVEDLLNGGEGNENRVLASYEKKQRGCIYCLHVTTLRHNGEIRNACPFKECPYEVLSKYKTYEQFMASDDSKIFATEYFQTIPCLYELSTFSHAPKGIFEDKGDFKMHF